MKDHQRILLGDEIADRELAAVMLPVPVAELADIQQEAQLVLHPRIAGLEPQQCSLPWRKRVVGQRRLAVEDFGLGHAAQSLRCIPQPLLA